MPARPRRRWPAIPAKSMQVKTERVFRSGETPQLKLATRNVPAVKVRVYKIDLETYFRKMHSIAGIQRLDVSLIDPDPTFEFAVPEYAKYKPLTSSIPVPLPDGVKAGVAAVTVSSRTLETTTLLIQSDLEILVEEFARRGADLRREHGDRQAVARRAFADFRRPQRVCRGEDGRRRLLPPGYPHPALKVAASLRPSRMPIPVGLGAGPESNEPNACGSLPPPRAGTWPRPPCDWTGESVVHELADRIYVDTDRADYFAGETVHVRGCARHADGDRFAIEPGKKLTVEVLGDADRRLRRREVTLSAAGTFSCDFLLPAEMPEGTYKVRRTTIRPGIARPSSSRSVGRRKRRCAWSSTCPSRSIIAARSSKARFAPCCPRTALWPA